MKYTYNVGPEMGATRINKESVFNEIVDMCDDLNDCDKLIVFNFGERGDLLLDILKDSEYDAEKDPDYSNIVTIVTSKANENGKMEAVDDTEDTYVTDGSLYKELERIWSYKDFGLL